MASPDVGTALTPENMLGLPGEDLSDIPVSQQGEDPLIWSSLTLVSLGSVH